MEDIFGAGYTQGNVLPPEATLSEYYKGDIYWQRSFFKSGEGKVKESLVAHDVVDKCKISRKIIHNKLHTNHVQQAHPVKTMKW